MLRGKLRTSLLSFTHEVENNGIAAAIRRQSSPIMMDRGDLSDHDDGHHYTLGDHMEYLHIHQSPKQSFYCDVGHLMTSDSTVADLVRDFVHPIPESQLEEMYFGMDELSYRYSSSNAPLKESSRNLPVRTMTMRLCPEVMTAVVLDAVQEACENQADSMTQVLKRLQGHFQCLLVPDDDTKLPFIVDAMVVTSKSGMLDRLLLLRVFYASGDSTNATSVPTKRQVAQQHRAQTIRNVNNADMQVMIPINLHLRAAAAFVQFIQKQQQRSKQPLMQKCPQPSPKLTTSHFMSTYEPTLSVHVQNDQHQQTAQPSFPCLNSDDWSLLQSSWSTLSAIWNTLGTHKCLFHMVELSQESPLVLDYHYCTQIRQLARERMLAELQDDLAEMQRTLLDMEKAHAGFTRIMERARQRYKLPPLPQRNLAPLNLKEPASIPPPNFTRLAEIASNCVKSSGKAPTAVCDEVVTTVYKTFVSLDDHQCRQSLKDANALVTERLVQIQQLQGEWLLQVQRHPNTQVVAKIFGKFARLATNSVGRFHRVLPARVPLVEFDILNGKCQITATSILCRKSNILLGRDQYFLFDLKVVDCIVVSPNCMIIRGKAAPAEELFQLHTSTDLVTLSYVITTLQHLQGVFEEAPDQQQRCAVTQTQQHLRGRSLLVA